MPNEPSGENNPLDAAYNRFDANRIVSGLEHDHYVVPSPISDIDALARMPQGQRQQREQEMRQTYRKYIAQ